MLGNVFFDPHFKFRDGGEGEKLFVVLGGAPQSLFVVARTTSQSDNRSRSYGCNLADRYPNFYIPKEAGIFRKDTWVCLDYFVEFTAAELIAKSMQKSIKSVSRLTHGILRDLITCALGSEDITQAQAEVLQQAFKEG